MSELENEALLKAISPYGKVSKPEILVDILQRKAYIPLSCDDIIELFNEQKVEVRYYKEHSMSMYDYEVEFSEEEMPLYKFIKLNNERCLLRDELYASFILSVSYGTETKIREWRGAFINVLDRLYNKTFIGNIKPKIYVTSAPATEDSVLKRSAIAKFDGYSDDNFYEALYQNLFLKEIWVNMVGSVAKYTRLNFYLTNLCACIKYVYLRKLETGCYRECEYNGNKHILFDCRLLDKYGNRIFLIHRVEKYIIEGKVDIRFVEPKHILNTQDLVKNGFGDVLLRDIKPFPFYKDRGELVFEGGIEDIDLDDTHHLNHIIKERKDRLPARLRDKSELEIYNRLRMSVEYAVRLSQIDFKLITPTYSVSKRKIQFFVPFYEEIGNSKPSCAIIMDKQGARWVIYTILPLDVAYNNARLLSIPSEWLNPYE